MCRLLEMVWRPCKRKSSQDCILLVDLITVTSDYWFSNFMMINFKLMVSATSILIRSAVISLSVKSMIITTFTRSWIFSAKIHHLLTCIIFVILDLFFGVNCVSGEPLHPRGAELHQSGVPCGTSVTWSVQTGAEAGEVTVYSCSQQCGECSAHLSHSGHRGHCACHQPGLHAR